MHIFYIKNNRNRIKQFSVNKKLKYIPSDEDIEAVKEIFGDGQKNLIDFVMETGCRISEALRLKAIDVNKDFIVLYTRKSKNSDLVPRKVPRTKCLEITEVKDRVLVAGLIHLNS